MLLATQQFCGCCIKAKNLDNNRTTTVFVDARCDTCEPGGLDFSEDKFLELADSLVPGYIDVVEWEVVPCDVQGNIEYHFAEGASRWWFSVYVKNLRVGIEKLEIRANNTDWLELPRKDYNQFNKNFDYLSGLQPPISLRATSQLDEVILDENIIGLLLHCATECLCRAVLSLVTVLDLV